MTERTVCDRLRLLFPKCDHLLHPKWRQFKRVAGHLYPASTGFCYVAVHDGR